MKKDTSHLTQARFGVPTALSAPRTAYFLDLDNLVGTGRPTRRQIEEFFLAFEEAYDPGPGDQVYCAGTRTSAAWAGFARPGYLTRSGVGRDGADRRLLDLADPAWLSTRFGRVVIGSGDGIFAGLVDELRMAGLQVELVTGRGFLHQSLYRSVAPREAGAPTPRTHLALAA